MSDQTDTITALRRMEDCRVFSIERRGDAFYVEEACDYHFGQTLSREELRQLGEEIISLADATAP